MSQVFTCRPRAATAAQIYTKMLRGLARTALQPLGRRLLSSAEEAGPSHKRIADLITARTKGGWAEAPALVIPTKDIRWSYGELGDRIKSFAFGLRDLGYEPGNDRLGIKLPNGYELYVALMGAALNATPVETAKTVEALKEVKCR